MAYDENVRPQPQPNPQESESGQQPIVRPPVDPDLSDHYKREPSLTNVEKR